MIFVENTAVTKLNLSITCNLHGSSVYTRDGKRPQNFGVLLGLITGNVSICLGFEYFLKAVTRIRYVLY